MVSLYKEKEKSEMIEKKLTVDSDGCCWDEDNNRIDRMDIDKKEYPYILIGETIVSRDEDEDKDIIFKNLDQLDEIVVLQGDITFMSEEEGLEYIAENL